MSVQDVFGSIGDFVTSRVLFMLLSIKSIILILSLSLLNQSNHVQVWHRYSTWSVARPIPVFEKPLVLMMAIPSSLPELSLNHLQNPASYPSPSTTLTIRSPKPSPPTPMPQPRLPHERHPQPPNLSRSHSLRTAQLDFLHRRLMVRLLGLRNRPCKRPFTSPQNLPTHPSINHTIHGTHTHTRT